MTEFQLLSIVYPSSFQFETVAILNDTAVNLLNPSASVGSAAAHHQIIHTDHHPSNDFNATQIYAPISSIANAATPTETKLLVTIPNGVNEHGHGAYDSATPDICKYKMVSQSK